ncbi:translation initiation factor IF-2-like [Cricetulus griseus]|uniref:translation initiation factor IF-2-like n=1 Tax=Cricetulus griseus TaxID=10029 RepID=UPI0015C3849D|nr:translation initiation factor IF-2-like [Cricetulus griseus]
MVPESRRPLGRSVLGLVSPKFLSLSGSPHPPRIPGRRSRPQVAASPGAEWSRSRLQLLVQSGRAARSADRRAESQGRGPPPPRGRGAEGGGRRTAHGGQRGARSGPLSPPARTPRPRPRGQARQRPRQPGRAP